MPTKKVSTNKTVVPPVRIDNAKVIYRNFAGAKKQFNAKGDRNFHVVLDPQTARVMEKDGWNVRWHDPRDEGDEAWASIKVAVRFENYPPRIVQVTDAGKVTLDEDTVEILDWAEIKSVDLVLNGSAWSVNDKSGIKAYLRKMFVTLSEDDLEAKYATPRRESDDEEDD